MLLWKSHAVYAKTSLEISKSAWKCQKYYNVFIFLNLLFCCLMCFKQTVLLCVRSVRTAALFRLIVCKHIDIADADIHVFCTRTQGSRGPHSSLMQMQEIAAKVQTKALEGCQPKSSRTVWNGWRTMSEPKFPTATVFHLINVRTSS